MTPRGAPREGRWPPRKIALYAALTAVAVALSAAESAVPVLVPAPGVKLGIANSVALLILLNEKNPLYAVAVTVTRCVITAFISGMISALLFSLAGGLFSCIVMWLLLHFNFPFSAVGVSVAGAVSHNAAQLATAALIIRDPAVIIYAPVLLFFGTASGCAVGYAVLHANRIIKSHKKLYFTTK